MDLKVCSSCKKETFAILFHGSICDHCFFAEQEEAYKKRSEKNSEQPEQD